MLLMLILQKMMLINLNLEIFKHERASFTTAIRFVVVRVVLGIFTRILLTLIFDFCDLVLRWLFMRGEPRLLCVFSLES